METYPKTTYQVLMVIKQNKRLTDHGHERLQDVPERFISVDRLKIRYAYETVMRRSEMVRNNCRRISTA